MDEATLRWILIVIGALVIGGILLFGDPGKRKPKTAKNRRQRNHEPQLGDLADDTDSNSGEQQELGDMFGSEQAGAPEETAAPKPKRINKPVGPPPDKIVTLYLAAREAYRISGVQLLDAAIKAGLEFGEMDIFHRLQEGGDKPVFSMANISAPGSFDRAAWNTFETTGVALFMALPGPLDALDAWDTLLPTARRLAELLKADLLDDGRCPLTRQRIAQVREEMREYDRQRAVKNSGEA